MGEGLSGMNMGYGEGLVGVGGERVTMHEGEWLVGLWVRGWG